MENNLYVVYGFGVENNEFYKGIVSKMEEEETEFKEPLIEYYTNGENEDFFVFGIMLNLGRESMDDNFILPLTSYNLHGFSIEEFNEKYQIAKDKLKPHIEELKQLLNVNEEPKIYTIMSFH